VRRPGATNYIGRVSPLAEASLSPVERRAVERAVAALRETLGGDLISVWLYGSRARCEPPRPESDVDLLVLTRAGRSDLDRVSRAVWDVMLGSGDDVVPLSAKVFDPQWLAQRRDVESFFIQEVDRDKIVLFGEP